MENVSAVTSLILTAYTELEDHRYLYFVCFLLLYVAIIVVNSVIIIAIYIEQGLHEPLYLFICSLAINGVFGSTSLLPPMLVFLLSHSYEMSLTCCLLQIYCIHTHSCIEFTVLAVMSYDRYVAICHPLHYHLLMSPKKMCAAIILSWVIPLIYFGLYFIMTTQRTFCGRIIEKLYCINSSLIKLSCIDTPIQNFVGVALLLVSPCSQIVMILFSYGQILRVCLFASKESQAKAIKTCTPHLLIVINVFIGVIFEVIQGRFDMTHVPYEARIFMSLYFLIFPPLFNPVIYGISIQAIRVQVYKLFITN